MAQIRFQLTPLTPIHIGTGESLEPFEYVIDGHLLYRFSLDAFMLTLPPETQALFVEAVEQGVPDTRQFVASQADVAKRVARYTADVSAGAGELYGGQMDSGEAHPEILSCIRTNDRAYLPGSSLKGALRTALLYQAMDKGSRERNARRLEQRLFRFQKVQEDPFRAFKVGDGEMLEARTRVHAVGVQVRREWGWQEKLSVLVETLPGALSDGAEYTSSHAVTFDGDFYRYHQGAFSLNAAGVLAACRAFYLAHLEAEQKATADLAGASDAYRALAAHAEQLPDHACLVRLAWGSGRDATTVAYGLEGAYRPRSRRITGDGFPLGWAELALFDDQGTPLSTKATEPVQPPAPRPPQTDRPRSLRDLQPGMILGGTVRRTVNYGAFVDLGVGRDGLIHISKLADRFVNMVEEIVIVGDRVRVEVLEVDLRRKRISLKLVEVLS